MFRFKHQLPRHSAAVFMLFFGIMAVFLTKAKKKGRAGIIISTADKEAY